MNRDRVVDVLRVHKAELELQNETLRAVQRDLVMQNTALRVFERELELTHERYRDRFDLTPAGYVKLDAAGRVRHANRSAEVLLAAARGRLLARSLAEFTDGADLQALRAHLRTASLRRDTCEVGLRRFDGSILHARAVSRPARDGGCMMVLQDIGEQRRIERALATANRELEARVLIRTRELAARNAALEAALRAQAASEAERLELAAQLGDAERLEGLELLAGGIAHDFNNLLVGVMANAELLLDMAAELHPVVQEGLVTIKDAARDAANVTRKLLLYAGRVHVSLEPVQLDDLVSECLRLLRATAPKSVALRAELDTREYRILADAGQVRHVVINLVTNAWEAVGENVGTVTVRTRVEAFDAQALACCSVRTRAAPGRFVVLEVEDTGIGMSTEQLSRIFEPFYTSKFAGRGLGLASVRGIVHSHGAALGVRSRPSQGSTFQILWSLANVPSAANPTVVPAATRWRGSGQALLVDDDPIVLRSLARQLTAIGFAVTEACSGARALELFRANPTRFRVAVVDRTMPGLSGDHLIELLHDIEPGLPVVLVSGYSAMGPAVASERVVFLPKPMTIAQLRQVLSKLLDGESRRATDGVDRERAAR